VIDSVKRRFVYYSIDVILDDSRVPLIVALLAIGGIILSGYTTGLFYPWTITVFFVSMAILVVLALKGCPLFGVVTGGVLVGVGYRLYFIFHAPGGVGMSPHGYPSRINSIATAGDLSAVGGYYANVGGAPFQDLLYTSFVVLAGVDGFYSFVLYPVLIALIYPLFALGSFRALDITDHRIQAVSAILVLVTTEGLRRAYWPRNQVIAMFFFVLAIYVLLKYIRTPTRQFFFLIAGFSVSMAFSHRLPLAVFSFVLLVLLILYLTERITWNNLSEFSPTQQLSSLFVFIFVLTWAQMIYLGQTVDHLISRIYRILGQFGDDGVDLQSTGGESEATAATEALPGIIANFYEYPSALTLFIERGHGVWILLVAGGAWAYLYFFMRDERHREQVLVILAVSSGCVALTFLGVISIRGMNPTRPLHLIEPILVVIVAVAIWHTGALDRPRVIQVAVGLVLALLIASQVFSMAAAPDYANSPRYYSDVSEATAKTTICDYSPETVYVDREMSLFRGIDGSSCSVEQFDADDDGALFNAEINPSDHPAVVYRQNVDVYHGRFDRYRLTWDPATELESEYHTVYDNGNVVLFSRE